MGSSGEDGRRVWIELGRRRRVERGEGLDDFGGDGMAEARKFAEGERVEIYLDEVRS